MFVRLISLGGQYPELVVLTQAIILNISISILTFNLIKNPRQASFVSTLICISPTVGAMGITLWRDIPFTSGLLLLGPYVLWVARKKSKLRVTHIFSGLLIGVLLSFKQNGFPILLILIITLLIWRKYHLIIGIWLPFLVTLILTASILLYSQEDRILAKTYAIEWMRSDVSCFASEVSDSKFAFLIKSNVEIRSNWAAKEACTFINKSFAPYSKEDLTSIVPRYWFNIFRQDPIRMISIHIKRNSYLFPPLLVQPPKIPFLHTTIEIKDSKIQNQFPQLVEEIRVFPRIWNYFRGLFSWSGFWLTFLAFHLLIESRNKQAMYFALLTGIVLSITLFISAPIPDSRYALFNLIVGQVAGISLLLNQLQLYYCRIRN